MGNFGAVNFTASELKRIKRFNLSIEKSEYCEYGGYCEEELNTSDCCLCWLCKHMKRDFDIPEVIKNVQKCK